MAKRSGTGQGGKTLNDRKLSAKVRTKALEDLYLILTDNPEVAKWSDLKKRVLEKMSTTILPRLNEHTGEDGEPLRISFDNAFTPGTEEDRG